MNHLLDRPRQLGLLCAIVAVSLGVVYLAMAGAPARYLAINVGALVLGVALWLGVGRASEARWSGAAIIVLALSILATALLGTPVEGAARWISLGPLVVQVSLVLLPAAIVLYARPADALGTAGIVLAALALALQPDRANAAALAAGTGAVLLLERSRFTALAFAAAAAGFAAAMLQPDNLPAVPYVDRIFFTAFDVSPLAGGAVLAGSLLLLLPVLSATRGRVERTPLAAFGACWATIIAAAAIADYPTPLVGYGGSAILGYLLSVALLPSRTRED
jgi:cell division protein FtsW (lipid II flippase)